MAHFISALQNPWNYTSCIVILNMMLSRIAKIRLNHEEIGFDQHLEYHYCDFVQSMVPGVYSKSILTGARILALNPRLTEIFSVGGFNNEI